MVWIGFLKIWFFSLLEQDTGFSLANYCKAIEDELKGFGLSVTVEQKDKLNTTNIDSAFIKAGTLQNMIAVDIPEPLRKKMHSRKLMKIRLEVDTDPPGAFYTEAKYLFQPVPFSVNVYALPYLFAGKMHAILCRSWGKRVKGRDWYDLVWYAGRNQPVALKHLENRMKQTGHIAPDGLLSEDILKEKLHDRIMTTDFNDARKDVENLLKDPSSLELWSEEFFRIICEKILVID